MTTQQLTFGTQITAAADQSALRPISMAEVFRLITADVSLQQTTERLRSLRAMDKEAYRTVKTRLPYVVGSQFEGAIRRTDAFVAAHYFVLDLDECPGLDGRVPDVVRENEAVELAFVSPSGQGLKLFFRLLEPCTDTRQFSAAYRNFATHFGAQYRWTSSIDLRTSDVTRACFLAHDPSAYYNPDAFSTDWRVWLTDPDEPETIFSPSAQEPAAVLSTARPINEAAYRDVLKQINPRTTLRNPVRPERQVFVPDALRELEPEVRAICQRLNWELTEVATLNYGLKFVVRQGFRKAEVNAFHGKRGFSLVRSPKTGTDPALTDLLYSQLFGLLFPESVTTDVLSTTTVSAN
jgi:hypothetical protein